MDITSKGFVNLFLDIIPYFSILFGICVINSKNPVVSILFLIGLFVSVSINLILVGYSFIGLSYLLVYVGAISILFIFILMLINIRISELLDDTNNNIGLAVFTCIFFGFPLYKVLNLIDLIKDKYNYIDLSFWLSTGNLNFKYLNYSNLIEELIKDNSNNYTFNNIKDIKSDISIDDKKEILEINYVTSNTWDNSIIEFSDISSIGNILYTKYSIWLIICSIILLLAMIGAISITKKDK